MKNKFRRAMRDGVDHHGPETIKGIARREKNCDFLQEDSRPSFWFSWRKRMKGIDGSPSTLLAVEKGKLWRCLLSKAIAIKAIQQTISQSSVFGVKITRLA